MLSLTRLSRCSLGRCLRQPPQIVLYRAGLRLSNPHTRHNSSSANENGASFQEGLGTLSVPISAHGNVLRGGPGSRRSRPPHLDRGKSDNETGIAKAGTSSRRRSPSTDRRPNPSPRRRRLARAQAQRQSGSKMTKESNDRRVGRSGKQEVTSKISADDTTNETPVDYDPNVVDEAVASTSYADKPLPLAEETLSSGSIQAEDVKIEEVVPLREMKVARLAHGLHRVLFNPGVHQFRDLRSGVWNFPSNFVTIPKPEEYAFDRSPKYITPSQDEELLSLAKREQCQFIGSTSTLTQAFSNIYFAISGGKGVDLSSFSGSFASERSDFTSGAELPAALILGPLEDGRYYVDSDKQYDTENILSEYGVILEKLLVTDPTNFKRFLNSSPSESVTEEERTEKEAYRYSKSGSLMMRSQLDCQDHRLPGSGVFDIKTRACLPIRHDRANYLQNSMYSIVQEKGATLSFEKEYYDIVRAGMLKWSMQARIGGMDGIFVAYHNTKRLFGFQYLPMAEIDERLFGSSDMGNQAFNLVVSLFEALIGHCAEAFPGQELSVTLRRTGTPDSPMVTAFVTPTGEGEQPVQAVNLNLTSYMNGRRIHRLLDFDPTEPQKWSVDYTITKSAMDSSTQSTVRSQMKKAVDRIRNISSVSVPEGKTPDEMTATNPGVRWKMPDKRIHKLRAEAKESAVEYAKMRKRYKEGLVAWQAPK